jgi:carbonic anhydrase
MKIEKIIENNEVWIQQKLALDPDYFTKLSQGQNPEILYIGCSDSRVTAEEIIGADAGEVFVHRNIANQVIPTDANVNAVVQYAVEHLKVKHIVICGHYECGGIKAALNPQDLGQINNWLQSLRDVCRLHQDELSAIKDEKQRFDRMVEINVLEQAINVIKLDHFQKSWHQDQGPNIHGWVFNIHNGKIIDLKLDMEQEMEKLKHIYDLYAD